MSTTSGDSGVFRHRGLIIACALVAAVIATGLLAGRSGSNNHGAGRPRVSFGAHIRRPAGTDRALLFTNGWIASSDGRAIAIYAAGQPGHRGDGLFVIQRQSGEGHGWRTRTVVVHGSGSLTLLRPAAPQTQAAADGETLHFVTASGSTGTISLSSGKIALSH